MATQTSNTKTKLRMIYNDDIAIIDFLADLTDREPLHSLQRFLNDQGDVSMCLLYDVPLDGLVLIVLYKSPFKFNEGDNKLVVFAHPKIEELIKHFQFWLNSTAPENAEYYGALKDILNLLNGEWIKKSMKDQPD